jgi:hypothetical protein
MSVLTLWRIRVCASLPLSYSERSPSPPVFSPPVSHIQSGGPSSESLSEGDDGFANVGAGRVPILNLVALPTAAVQETSNGAVSVEETARRQLPPPPAKTTLHEHSASHPIQSRNTPPPLPPRGAPAQTTTPQEAPLVLGSYPTVYSRVYEGLCDNDGPSLQCKGACVAVACVYSFGRALALPLWNRARIHSQICLFPAWAGTRVAGSAYRWQNRLHRRRDSQGFKFARTASGPSRWFFGEHGEDSELEQLAQNMTWWDCSLPTHPN